MAHQKELPKKSDCERIIGELCDFAEKFCIGQGLPPVSVIKILLAAAGAYGWRLADKNLLIEEIKMFLMTTRQMYPQHSFEDDPMFGQYMAYIRHMALEEKRWNTVH